MSSKKYRTILIDPPWPERGGGKCKRGADRHYSLLSVRDIPRVILSAPLFNPDDNAHCYLWATNNYLPDALWVMSMIGFEYKTKITWGKDRVGLGQYFRGQTEDLLFGVRGKGRARDVCTQRRDLTTLQLSCKSSRHSEKPEVFYQLIEGRSKGPYLEMFARAGRAGWEFWGDEM